MGVLEVGGIGVLEMGGMGVLEVGGMGVLEVGGMGVLLLLKNRQILLNSGLKMHFCAVEVL